MLFIAGVLLLALTHLMVTSLDLVTLNCVTFTMTFDPLCLCRKRFHWLLATSICQSFHVSSY